MEMWPLRAAAASFCAFTTTVRARSVYWLKPALGSRAAGLAENRFCTACLVTPMLRPISVQDAPEWRA